MYDTERDYQMMSDPDRWPLRFQLPLKHSTEKIQGWPRMATLVNIGPNHPYMIFFDKTVYDTISLRHPDKTGGSEMLRELIDAGWIVD